MSVLRYIILSNLILISISAQSFAITPKDILDGKMSDRSFRGQVIEVFRNFGLNFGFNNTYKIGDEWGKKIVTASDLASDVNFARMARATALIRGGGTGFFLGEFNGKFIMATNHHVCETFAVCSGPTDVRFPLLNITTHVVEFYGSWPEIDLALFSIEVIDPNTAQLLRGVASPFAFQQDLTRRLPLVTIGFGVGDNPNKKLVANRDSDCVVFSGEGEYRLMADPDALNPGPYKAWSFANGCDVSHGDSGSAMMDRNSGRVIGIIWTGRIPKSANIQSSAFLNTLLDKPTEDIWQELSYGVPAVHMYSFLRNEIDRNNVNESFQKTLETMLASP